MSYFAFFKKYGLILLKANSKRFEDAKLGVSRDILGTDSSAATVNCCGFFLKGNE